MHMRMLPSWFALALTPVWAYEAVPGRGGGVHTVASVAGGCLLTLC